MAEQKNGKQARQLDVSSSSNFGTIVNLRGADSEEGSSLRLCGQPIRPSTLGQKPHRPHRRIRNAEGQRERRQRAVMPANDNHLAGVLTAKQLCGELLRFVFRVLIVQFQMQRLRQRC